VLWPSLGTWSPPMLTSGKQEMCLVLTEWYQPYSSNNLNQKGNRILHFLKLIDVLPCTSSVVVIDSSTLGVHGRTVAQIRVPQTLRHRRGQRNVQNTKICCGIVQTGLHSSVRRHYSGSLLWDLGVTSPNIMVKAWPVIYTIVVGHMKCMWNFFIYKYRYTININREYVYKNPLLEYFDTKHN
jgi:hypothetical protein